ncbi:cell adhesion molecule Dscam1-like isoform X2 [Brevipalpus obovatus]|uniref:cell adhesion molecule Dscam1-like isoform X2 n=1 Tax=Brevipalpus obovatus TaxID=246614 RepID=UPI003D9E92BB
MKIVLEKPVEIKVQDIRAHVGSNCILKCTIDDYHQDHYQVSSWTTDDGLIFLPVAAYNDDPQGNWPERRYIILSDGNLFVSNLSEKDFKRRFRCQVKNRLTGERIDSSQWLRILPSSSRMDRMSPQLIHEAIRTRIHVMSEGDSVVLHCPIEGWPLPFITWTRYPASSQDASTDMDISSPKLSATWSGPILILHKIETHHAGKYRCSASNSLGRSNFELELIVRSPMLVNLRASTLEPNLGEHVTLNCSVMDNHSAKFASTSGDKRSGDGPSRATIIREIVWIRNTHQVSYDSRITLEKDHLLKIRSFRFADNGIYQCFMRTLDTEHSHNERWIQGSILLRIAEREPRFGAVFSEQVGVIGNQLSLKCLAFGQPSPSIRWQIDGTKVSNGHRHNVGYLTTDGKGYVSHLNISSLTIQDAGNYECIASNLVGTISHQARIDIIGNPGIKPMENITAIMGDTFSLYCPYIGYPVDEVYFMKDDRRLPSEERHVHIGLGRVNIVSLTKEDAGFYKCIVSPLDGERYENLFHLRIVAPPILSPFHFPNNLEEGMRTSIMCSVVSGDPPISVEWLKDGQIISDHSHGSFQIVSITEYVSSLIIENLNHHHSGNYTCRAFNQYSSASHSALLTVRTKPYFVLRSVPRISIAETSILMDCQADGQPEPVIRWKYTPSTSVAYSSQVPSQVVESTAILSSPRVHALENGSLMIRSLTNGDEGIYHCEANNGLGKGISVSAYLKVNEAPKIRPLSSKTTVKRSETAEIICRVTGTFPIYIEWFKNGQVVSDDSLSSVYVIREEETEKFKVSMLIISSTSRNDTANFACSAVNYYGHANLHIKLIVQEQSDPPSKLQVIQIRSRSVTISWPTPFNGNSPILGFHIEYRLGSETWSEAKSMYLSGSNTNTAVISDLTPLTDYYLKVRAENSVGKSLPSPELHFTTRMEAPKEVPENISAVPIDSKSIKVTWIMRNSNVAQFVDGFYIGHKIAGSSEAFTFNTMHIPVTGIHAGSSGSGGGGGGSGSSTSEETSISNDTGSDDGLMRKTLSSNGVGYPDSSNVKHFYSVIHSLRKSTKYAIMIQAFNKEGEGPYSDQVFAQTFANDPPKPPKLSFESSTIDSASLTWSVHHEDRDSLYGFILNFKVEKFESNTYDVIKLPKSHQRYLLSNLLCGTKYLAKICAYNEVGRSEFSSEIKFATDGSAPIAPGRQSFIRSNISSTTLTLSTWSDGKCPIDHFEIQYKPKFNPEWILVSNHIIAHHERVEIRDLSPGTWYDLMVVAKNEAGITEAKYHFATLTETGGTVAPLLLSGENRVSDELMILVPSISAIIVLLLVTGFAVYFLLNKTHHEANQSESYGGQQAFDSVSLHSYNKTPKNESFYEPQRVYCPSVYNTSAIGEAYRGNNQVHSCADQSEYRTVIGGRVLRKGSFDHVYDLPHRYQKESGHIVIN